MRKWLKKMNNKDYWSDFIFIWKGIIIILIFLVIGINGAEKGINDLTNYQYNDHALNFKIIEPGDYQISFLGKVINIRQLLSIGRMKVRDGKVNLQFNKDAMAFEHVFGLKDVNDLKASGKNK